MPHSGQMSPIYIDTSAKISPRSGRAKSHFVGEKYKPCSTRIPNAALIDLAIAAAFYNFIVKVGGRRGVAINARI